MALIAFEFNKMPATDAVNVKVTHYDFERSVYIDGTYDHNIGNYGGKKIGPSCLVTWHTHVGLCLRDTERNGYHDSDFYMLVWNEEKQAPESICFASTRGWSYPSYGSFVDATDEIKAKYAAWQKKQEAEQLARRRHSAAVALVKLRAEVRKVAAEHGVSAVKLQKLRKSYTRDAFESIIALFSKRVRNNFKLKLRAQVIAWLQDDAPKYATPLSANQMRFV